MGKTFAVRIRESCWPYFRFRNRNAHRKGLTTDPIETISVPQVKCNGDKIGEFDSRFGSVSTSLGIQQNGVDTVKLEAIGIGEDEWVSLLEVSQ